MLSAVCRPLCFDFNLLKAELTILPESILYVSVSFQTILQIWVWSVKIFRAIWLDRSFRPDTCICSSIGSRRLVRAELFLCGGNQVKADSSSKQSPRSSEKWNYTETNKLIFNCMWEILDSNAVYNLTIFVGIVVCGTILCVLFYYVRSRYSYTWSNLQSFVYIVVICVWGSRMYLKYCQLIGV